MSAITDAQQLALQGGVATPLQVAPAGYEITESVVSGTPFQISTLRAATLYLSIQTSASLTISMGPEAAGTSVPVAAAAADAIGVITIRVPLGWFVKLTGTVADFTAQAVLESAL